MTRHGRRVLVVDDDPTIREMVIRGLSTAGHEVDAAEGGEEALRMLRSRPYDHIFLDLRMPGMSGQDLYKLLKTSDPKLASRVTFITGEAARPEVTAFLESVGNPVLTKPFDLHQLRGAVACPREAPHVGE